MQQNQSIAIKKIDISKLVLNVLSKTGPINKSSHSTTGNQSEISDAKTSPLLAQKVANFLNEAKLTQLRNFYDQAPKKGGEVGDYNSHAELITEQKTPPSPALPVVKHPTAVVTNVAFINAIFSKLPKGTSAVVCSKSGDPTIGSWFAKPANHVGNTLPPTNNNYYNCSTFNIGENDSITARKENFASYCVIVLDDLGTKIPFERLGGFNLSYLIETSPSNFQGGIILTNPINDGDEANILLDAVIAAGLCDQGASGPQTRWARLPVGINGKSKYVNEAGNAFKCCLTEWHPERTYTQQEIIDGLRLVLVPEGGAKLQQGLIVDNVDYSHDNSADDVFTPKSAQNPVITVLKARGLYKTPLGSGKHDVTCPWVKEHTDALDTGTAYFEPDDTYPIGGFCCQHSHGDKYKTKNFLEFLNIQNGAAKNKPEIRIVDGDLHSVINAAEKILASTGKHYQAGGLIVTIATNLETGDPAILPINLPVLTRTMSHLITWSKFSAKVKSYISCDPPARHIGILHDNQNYIHLPNLNGIARQPYFRETDGDLVSEPGYDKLSQRFGVFDARKFVMPEPTIDAANTALLLLENLLDEFSFVAEFDKAAAIAAIITAVVRPSFAYAPGFHVKASTIGSGKSYLCDLISAFAKTGETKKVSYPSTSDEATKSILSLLLSSPAVIEFDDMATDWIPHGVINRIFTAGHITERILGVSKSATVSTRTLFLGSGNNVGPVRDLLRRILTINIDHRCATPATKSYIGTPVETVRNNRGHYVAAVLTIIMAWKAAGSPRAEVENIATFGGAWADYCRHPLIWLGLADPATALLEQIKHDPDADALLTLMTSWYDKFGSSPTTVRKVISSIESLSGDDQLHEAICEFPIEERGRINPSKFGWILKKNANRIVGGYKFQQSTADGRTAWTVVKV